MINSIKSEKINFINYFSIVSFIFCSNLFYSQSLNIQYKDGNNISYNLELISKITFKKDTMKLYLKENTIYDVALNNISKYEYINKSLSIKDLTQALNSLEINLFPNPISNELYFQLNIIKESEMTVLICDLNGNEIKNRKIEKQPIGLFQNKINLSDLSTGTYLFRLICEDNVITKKIILN